VPQAAVDAMFRQAGVISVDTLDEMVDVGQLLAHQPLPRGRRVAVVGNSDALGLHAANAASAAGLQVRDPVTIGADATADDFERALNDAIHDPDIDAVMAIYIPPLDDPGGDVADVLGAVGEQADKPILATSLAREGVPELLRTPAVASVAGRGSVPSYASPEAAVRTLARVVAYASWRSRPAGRLPDTDHRSDRASALVASWLGATEGEAQLGFDQVGELLACYGIDLWRRIPVASPEAAVAAGDQLGWDVVLKATAHHLRNRPDLVHVWRSIGHAGEMRAAWSALVDTVGDPVGAGFVVQAMAPPGVPVSLESLEDPLFGPIISFGIEGAPGEPLGDRSYRIPPLTDVEAEAMMREVGSAPLLFGYRGDEAVDVDAVRDLLQRLAQLQHDLPEVARLDLDLVLAGPGGAAVLDASGQVAPASHWRSDLYVRRMQPVGLGNCGPG